VIATTLIDSKTITTWLNQIAVTVTENRDYLVQLDAAIGDGDHGINMTRGFDAVLVAVAAEDGAGPGRLLIVTGKTLISQVGGASGPLWGSAFRSAGRLLGEEQTIDALTLTAALEAAVAAVADLGNAAVGDKTMVDSLQPAVTVLRQQLESGEPLLDSLGAAAEAAEDGMRSTIPLQARRGRASYLGPRSIGHQDPGATSSAMIIRALETAVATSQPSS
jgi:phosphoenolpyruvate---glycerone phosphotransferase subunit DhaL